MARDGLMPEFMRSDNARMPISTTRLDPADPARRRERFASAAIRVLRCRFVPRTFHARFSARGKIYRYRIATTPVLSPFEVGRAWHVTAPLNDELLRACAKEFVGQHDFAGFAANRGAAVASTVRTIRRVRVATRSWPNDDRVRGRRFSLQDGAPDGGCDRALRPGQDKHHGSAATAAPRRLAEQSFGRTRGRAHTCSRAL